jgi:methylglyoxal synthase
MCHQDTVARPTTHGQAGIFMPNAAESREYPEGSHMRQQKRIALVAHDNKKRDLLEWARFNRPVLTQHVLYATETTGELLEHELGIDIYKLRSGPLGGDQQIGAMIAQGELDLLIFFWDPLQSLPHEPDVRALLRVAVVWNIPVACNRASADFIISSPMMAPAYQGFVPEYEEAVAAAAREPVRRARRSRGS